MSAQTEYEHAKYDMEHPLGQDTPRTVAYFRHLADALESHQVGLRDFVIRHREAVHDVGISNVEFEIIHLRRKP